MLKTSVIFEPIINQECFTKTIHLNETFAETEGRSS